MPIFGTKKPLNFHKFSLKIADIMSNWKIILPLICAFAGIIMGCFDGKGERSTYSCLTGFFSKVFMRGEEFTSLTSFLYYLSLPTAFFILIFFLGLSVFGSVATNAVPICYGYFVGCVSYYLYSSYTLVGLGYCIIMLYPYFTLTFLAIIFSCRESIKMSQLIVGCISKSKSPNYSFTEYYKAFIRNFIFIIAASGVKTVIDRLFGSLFAF